METSENNTSKLILCWTTDTSWRWNILITSIQVNHISLVPSTSILYCHCKISWSYTAYCRTTQHTMDKKCLIPSCSRRICSCRLIIRDNADTCILNDLMSSHKPPRTDACKQIFNHHQRRHLRLTERGAIIGAKKQHKFIKIFCIICDLLQLY